jgi:hypothetical protein
MDFIIAISLVLSLLGALARLTVGYSVDSRDLVEGDRSRGNPMWFARPGPVGWPPLH